MTAQDKIKHVIEAMEQFRACTDSQSNAQSKSDINIMHLLIDALNAADERQKAEWRKIEESYSSKEKDQKAALWALDKLE